MVELKTLRFWLGATKTGKFRNDQIRGTAQFEWDMHRGGIVDILDKGCSAWGLPGKWKRGRLQKRIDGCNVGWDEEGCCDRIGVLGLGIPEPRKCKFWHVHENVSQRCRCTSAFHWLIKGNATSQCNKQKILSQGGDYKMYFIRLSQSGGYLLHYFEDIKSKVKPVSRQNFALPLIALWL